MSDTSITEADILTRLAPIGIAAASAAALAAALLGEYVFDIVGCTLCEYQRVPYAATTAIAILAVMIRPSPGRLRLLLAACAVLFAVDCAIAVYQAGMQQGWWSQPGVCAAPLPSADALTDLRSARPARPACEEIDFSFMGLSLATLNALYAGALAGACVAMLLRAPSSPRLSSPRT